MKIYNSFTKRKEEFQPLDGKKVKMYACGITVSGEAHIGHGYQALIYDIMRKYLNKSGYDVTYARNYTDVDDKIIAKSHETGIPADKYAAMMIENINEIMEKFNVDDPDVWLKATQNIENIYKNVPQNSITWLFGMLDATTGWCECTECRKLDKAGKFDHINISTRFHKVVSRIMAEIYKKYPAAMLEVWAYHTYRTVPEKVQYDSQ